MVVSSIEAAVGSWPEAADYVLSIPAAASTRPSLGLVDADEDSIRSRPFAAPLLCPRRSSRAFATISSSSSMVSSDRASGGFVLAMMSQSVLRGSRRVGTLAYCLILWGLILPPDKSVQYCTVSHFGTWYACLLSRGASCLQKTGVGKSSTCKPYWK